LGNLEGDIDKYTEPNAPFLLEFGPVQESGIFVIEARIQDKDGKTYNLQPFLPYIPNSDNLQKFEICFDSKDQYEIKVDGESLHKGSVRRDF